MKIIDRAEILTVLRPYCGFKVHTAWRVRQAGDEKERSEMGMAPGLPRQSYAMLFLKVFK